jgi:hypothetical protein
MERQLIEEMSEMKGGRNRLRRIRDKAEEEIGRLEESCSLITAILGEQAAEEMQEPVDSIGE